MIYRLNSGSLYSVWTIPDAGDCYKIVGFVRENEYYILLKDKEHDRRVLIINSDGIIGTTFRSILEYSSK